MVLLVDDCYLILWADLMPDILNWIQTQIKNHKKMYLVTFHREEE